MDAWAIFEQAVSCHRQGALGQAESLYQKLLGTYPDHGVVNHLMGVLRAQQERFDEAVPFYETSLRTKPGDPAVLLDAGNTFHKLGRYDEALKFFEAALAAQPGYFEAINNRGNVFLEMGQMEDALACFDRALAIRPGTPETQFNRGVTLHRMRRFAEALSIFDQLLTGTPQNPKVFGEALASALRLCDWKWTARFAAEIPARVKNGITQIQPLTLMSYSSDPALLLRCARDTAKTLKPQASATLWSGEPYDHDRIRLGYLSSDFRAHPVAFQVTHVLGTHDRTRFEVIGLSSGANDGSDVRARMIGAVDQFHDVRTFPPRRIAEKLRALEIDILVDLNGLTEGTSLAALALRPCPVQATWLGYPGTTGADFVDYLIADRIVAPASQQEFYSEQLVHLPDSFFPIDSTRPTGATPTRAQAGLPQEGFVFCCFNNNWKITAQVFDIWMRLLRDVPGSTLWLKDYGESAAEVLRREAQARNIAPDRLVFAGNVPLAEHLARHALADLFLDTLPYGAHATAADALWAGLPVLTQIGDTFPGRVGASLLTAAGLPELITRTPQEYEATALALARDSARLKNIRDRLSANRADAPLFDMARFTRNLEAAYENMLKEKT
jgi:predicted O-linked N-acetylglucosamine transferase (SPINDLY family)